MQKNSRLWAVALIVFGIGFGLVAFKPVERMARPGGAAGGFRRYTFVETEATNLLVTDNSTNILYFYTVDQDKAPGDDLKLRGEINLSDVGKPVIKPKTTKP